MSNPIIKTERLILIAGTVEMARAELENPKELAVLLNADIHNPWPPPLNDEESMKFMVNYLEENPESNGWGFWYFLLKNKDEKPLAIGNGGFKGKPSSDGTVEIGYSIVESHQKHGYGTEAVKGLIQWAFNHPAINRIIAETLPHLRPSIRVLECNGFTLVGPGSGEGVIRFELTREMYNKT